MKNKKLALLVAMTIAFSTVSACGMADLQKNMWEGALSFVNSYTTGVLTELAPYPQELIDGCTHGCPDPGLNANCATGACP